MKKTVLAVTSLAILLFAQSTDQSFRFAIVGDRNGAAVANVFEEVIDEVKLIHPDFVINVGDLIPGYTEDTMVINTQWDTVMNIIKKLPVRFYFVPGNHDIQNEADRRIFKSRTGFDRFYSFDYKNNHFIVLDNTMTQWVAPQSMDSNQINWLRSDLEKNKKANNTFVFFHVPTYLDAFRQNATDSLAALFIQYNVKAVFTGHNHSYLYITQAATEFTVVGSSGGGLENYDPARGNFFQFLLVAVEGKEHDVAVIKKGSIFMRNVVTGDDFLAIERADREAVKIPDCLVKEDMNKKTLSLLVTVNNSGTDSLIQPLRWHFDSTRYRFVPADLALRLGPETKRDYQFKITIFNGANIFPIPLFTLAYPFTYGKVCSLRNYLPVRRVVTAVKTGSPPTIDGRMDDLVWKQAKPITKLGSYDGSSLVPSLIDSTHIFLAHDAENLYLGARCFDHDLSKLRANATENDGMTYMDDNLWFFLDSDFDKETYYQAIINSRGAVFDRLCRYKDGSVTKDLTWNGPWQIKSGLEKNAWVLEIKIPKKGLEPYSEKQWGFNFRRLQTRLNDAGFWTIPFEHNPNTFGIIEFE